MANNALLQNFTTLVLKPPCNTYLNYFTTSNPPDPTNQLITNPSLSWRWYFKARKRLKYADQGDFQDHDWGTMDGHGWAIQYQMDFSADLAGWDSSKCSSFFQHCYKVYDPCSVHWQKVRSLESLPSTSATSSASKKPHYLFILLSNCSDAALALLCRTAHCPSVWLPRARSYCGLQRILSPLLLHRPHDCGI